MGCLLFAASAAVFVGCSCCSGFGPIAQADTELNVPGHRLVWNDEFAAPSLDASKWDVATGVNAWYQRASDGRQVEPQWFNEPFAPWLQAGTINGERQYYSPDNVTVNAGVLQIQARRETVVNPGGDLRSKIPPLHLGKIKHGRRVPIPLWHRALAGPVAGGSGYVARPLVAQCPEPLVLG